eukprot:4565774-Amphidinium_carterae.1
MLALRGLDMTTIKVTARWSSDVIERYAKETPADPTRVAEIMTDQQPDWSYLKDEISKLQEQVQQIREVSAGSSMTKEKPSEDFVQNVATGVWHVIRRTSLLDDTAVWSAVCGWRVVAGDFTLESTTDDADRKCAKCFQN